MPPIPMSKLREHLSADATPVDMLVALLEDDFPDVDEQDLEDALADEPWTCEIDDGWVDLLELAEGVVLTHMLTEDDCGSGVLDAGTDLELWARLAHNGLALAGGGAVLGSLQPSAIIEGPQGWLDAYEPGTLISLRLRDGELELAACTDDALPADDADLLTDELQVAAKTAFATYLALRDRDIPIDPGVTLFPTLMQAIVDNPRLLRRPTAPITAVLLMAGLEQHGPDVGLAGVPWNAAGAGERCSAEP